jgi:hypothetical protein
MIVRVHVNQHVIRANAKSGATDPPISVKMGGATFLVSGVEFAVDVPVKVVYSPDKPLNCGAKVWVEADARVLDFTDDNRVIVRSNL